MFVKNIVSLKADSQMSGMSITAVNVGSRNINIKFLGLAVKDKSLGKGLKLMQNIETDMGGKGIIRPLELLEAQYKIDDLISSFSKIPNAKVFLYATDTEWGSYSKKLWLAKNIIDHLTT